MKTTRLVAISFIPAAIFILFGLWLTGTRAATSESAASALVPHIAVLPASTVKVGQEVLFDASGTVYTDTQMLLKGRYEWDFGDDTVAKFGDPYYYSGDGGIAISHFYMRPGVYTVTLTVSVWSQFDAQDYPIGAPTEVATATTHITVTGQPPSLPPWPDDGMRLDMHLDGNLTDSSPSGLVGQWRNGAGGFVPGIANQAADLTTGAYISVTDPGVFSGLNQISVSFWAKKALTSAYGTLLDKPGQFSVLLINASAFRVRLTTSQGAVNATAWNAYDVDNTHWHHYAFTYDGATIRAFIDGKELVTQPYSGTIANSTSNLLIGRSASDPQVFNGYVDEVRIYNHALSRNDLFVGFDLWHAPFHARIAQYIYAQIPSAAYSNPANRLRVTISDDRGYAAIVFEKAGLAAEERFLFRNAELPAGNYTLTAQLLDAGNGVLDTVNEWFSRPYDGAPRVGIDENNAFHVNGQPFFPVTPWLLNWDDMADWKANGYINALYAEGWYPTHNIASWTDYLTHAADNDLYVFGPERWFDLGLPISLDPAHRRHFARNANVNVLANYVTATRDLPALAAWMWMDEPDLGGRAQRVPPAVLRAWTYASHLNDPHHPVVTNLSGYQYLPHYGTYGADYDFVNNAFIFSGKRQFVLDGMGFDIYPLEYRLGVNLNKADRGPIDLYVEALDRFVANQYGLIPMLSFVEVCDINRSRNTPGPTEDQVLMEAWLNVVHGIKGVNWFHYFEYDTIQYGAMTKFTDQVNRLAPVILGPEPDIHVSDNANVQANRVDTMVRYHDGYIYVFAVRLTEPDPITGSLYTIIEPATIAVNFQLDTPVSSLAEVVDEGRSVPVAGGAFSDTFARNAVHIYRIPLAPLDLRGRPGNHTIYLDWEVNTTLPPTSTWTIAYDGPTGDQPSPITGIPSPTRAYTLTGLTNYVWYTVTLNAMVENMPFLTETVRVMPTDRFVYLPLVLKGY